MVEMCTDEGDTAEFGVSLQGDAGGSGVGLTLQRALASPGLEVVGEGDFLSVSSLHWIFSTCPSSPPVHPSFSCSVPQEVDLCGLCHLSSLTFCGWLGLVSGGPS